MAGRNDPGGAVVHAGYRLQTGDEVEVRGNASMIFHIMYLVCKILPCIPIPIVFIYFDLVL